MNQHLSSEETSGWIIGEHTPEVQRHIAECAQCRGELERIEYAFWQFRDSSRRWSDHWYAARDMRRTRVARFWRWLAATGALATVALAAVLQSPRPAPPAYDDEPFLQIPYVATLAPYEKTTVMRMDVPVTALIAAGFEVHAHEPGGALTVDLLVGQDGRAHAIRPVYRSVRR
jgi:hypothetical protein